MSGGGGGYSDTSACVVSFSGVSYSEPQTMTPDPVTCIQTNPRVFVPSLEISTNNPSTPCGAPPLYFIVQIVGHYREMTAVSSSDCYTPLSCEIPLLSTTRAINGKSGL